MCDGTVCELSVDCSKLESVLYTLFILSCPTMLTGLYRTVSTFAPCSSKFTLLIWTKMFAILFISFEKGHTLGEDWNNFNLQTFMSSLKSHSLWVTLDMTNEIIFYLILVLFEFFYSLKMFFLDWQNKPNVEVIHVNFFFLMNFMIWQNGRY